jgi:DNA-binding response OmpR family regulator
MALPDGNGQELLAEIRQAGYDMAVVMLTGSGNEELAGAVLKAGADDYVLKSQNYFSHLSMTIQYALQS